MLVYAKRAAPKEPKRRSRAGCIHCKEKKKKCNEVRPRCDRCIEKDLTCEYEAVKPRKRRRTSFADSALANDTDSMSDDAYQTQPEHEGENGVQKWEQIVEDQQFIQESTWNSALRLNDVEEIRRVEPLPRRTAIVRSRSQCPPDLAMIAPSPVPSPLTEFVAPLFNEFTQKDSRRALVHHFCTVLSHLIVFKEDTGNPFRQLVLPLSQASSPIMNAIFALSSAHLEHRGSENTEKSLDFHNKALQGLAKLIDQNDQSNREEVLGAIMLLVYYEVLVQKGSSNIVNGHLKGAMTVLASSPRISSPTSVFLERAFRFYDVIAALSLGTPPHAPSHPAPGPFEYPPSFESPNSPLSNVDTLLGLATDLWPIIHDLSHLLSYKNAHETALLAGQTNKASVVKTDLEIKSHAIERDLTSWQPPTFPDHSPRLREDTRMQSILNNAEAYRHSALVYLYRTIHELPRSHAPVQTHAHLSLAACSSVVRLSEKCGPMSALLWPLFVAACEASSVDDRALAAAAFTGTERRQGMTNIARAWEVVQEVWRRSDAAEGEMDVNWRDICNERGLSIVFG